MTIPSKESFEEFIELIDWDKKARNLELSNGKIVEDILYVGKEAKVNQTELKSILKQVFDVSIELEKTIIEHEVSKWFHEQKNYQEAKESIYYRRKVNLMSLDEYFELYSTKILEAWKINRGYNARRFMYFYFDPKNWSPSLMLAFLAEPFYYYFHTDKAEKLYTASINYKKIKKKYLNLIEEFEKINEFNEFLFSGANRHFLGRADKFHADDIRESDFCPPFKRNDKTIKERMLVYDLDVSLRKQFGRSKANATFYLLMLEGVQNNLESRAIERMLKQWKEKKEERREKRKAALELEKADSKPAKKRY